MKASGMVLKSFSFISVLTVSVSSAAASHSGKGEEGLITGFASQSPAAGFFGFLMVVAALLLVLQYSGKADVKGRMRDVFRRLRP